MKSISFFILALCACTVSYGQTLQSNQISGDISWEYQSYSLTQNPIPIIYTVYPNGNSENYEYSWRLQDGDWGSFSDARTFTLNFECNSATSTKCIIYCKIRDKNTKKTQILNLKHTVEICFLRKHNERSNGNPNQ